VTLFVYRGTFIKAVDGDTVDMQLDLGFRIYQEQRLRLQHIDTPERGQPGYTAAADAVRLWFATSPKDQIFVQTILDRSDKYGRLLAIISTTNEWTTSINKFLIDNGFAVRYEGGAK
jgi:micrococcal nuclease